MQLDRLDGGEPVGGWTVWMEGTRVRLDSRSQSAERSALGGRAWPAVQAQEVLPEEVAVLCAGQDWHMSGPAPVLNMPTEQAER